LYAARRFRLTFPPGQPVADAVCAALESNGIRKIDALGQKFDPNLHEVMFEADSDKPPGTVVQVIETGYTIHDRLECGIVLTGTEVKSLREGSTNLEDAYAKIELGEVWLIGSDIPEYTMGNRMNHKPKRPRKLLLHRRQIDKLIGAVEREGMTLVPLKLYFNDKGRAKIEIALAKGKKLHDKRETEKKHDWSRERGRLLRDKG